MRRFRLFSVLVTFCAGALLQAALTPQDKTEIMNYKLTMPMAAKILAALPGVTRLVLSAPDARERVLKATQESLEDRVKDSENSPATVALLKGQGLTPREYVIGVVALRMALLGASLPAGAKLPPTITASPANLAFVKAHFQELKPKMDAADRAGVPRGR
jgi:hypothetical protein